MIIAREFLETDKEQLLEMVEEINSYDGNFEGLVNLSRIIDFDEFLKALKMWENQELINSNVSPQTTFGLFDEEKLIGGFNIRHILKGTLINHGGNIGYLIRPSERNKGYGKILLKHALSKAKELGLTKVLVTCRNDNISSSKIIEFNGGIYENDYYDEKTSETYKRYWIKCI